MSEEVKSDITEVTSISVGDELEGIVIKIETSQAFVDVGYKFDGVLPISEVSSLHVNQISDVIQERDRFFFKVLRFEEDKEKLVLSKKAVDAERAWKELMKKHEADETITTPIQEIVKGGLVVDVGVRGFIPASLVERHYVEDFSEYKGRELTLKVIEIDPDKNKCILSRKAVLDDELNKKKMETIQSLQVGQILEGTVQRLTDFGAFVDIGGVDGLVHVSEIAWERVEHPSDVLSEGDKIKVRVLKVVPDNERISLSIKETMEGPWDQVSEHIQAGDILTGTVKRLVSFGAFVEVYPSVEGLVHVSQIAEHHVETPSEVLKEGQDVRVKVLSMQTDQKRISLSIKDAEEEKPKKTKKVEKENITDDDNGSGLNVTLGDVYPELRNLK